MKSGYTVKPTAFSLPAAFVGNFARASFTVYIMTIEEKILEKIRSNFQSSLSRLHWAFIHYGKNILLEQLVHHICRMDSPCRRPNENGRFSTEITFLKIACGQLIVDCTTGKVLKDLLIRYNCERKCIPSVEHLICIYFQSWKQVLLLPRWPRAKGDQRLEGNICAHCVRLCLEIKFVLTDIMSWYVW